MLKFDREKKVLLPLPKGDMKDANILERHHLQKAIVNSWEKVRSYIGLPMAYLIGQEIQPHSAVGDSIDLLAFDPDDNSLTVIELKRDKNKLQLLQALSYAAMVATWDKSELTRQIQKDINPEPEDLIDSIKNNEINFDDIRIILISEDYDPEVIITADWLMRQYEVQVRVFSLSLHTDGEEIIVDLDQKLPLKELEELWKERGRKVSSKPSDITWDEILKELKYPFAKRALDMCRREKEGNPKKKAFHPFRSKMHGYDWISIFFPRKYLYILMNGKPDNAESEIKRVFGDSVKVLEVKNGFSFNVETESQFEALVKWLGMKE